MKKFISLLLAAFCLFGSALVTNAETPGALSKGSKGDAVKALQQRLIDLDYLEGKADGAYGTMTAKAVSAFQLIAGIEVTGVADGATQSALYDDLAPENPKPNAALFDDVFIALVSSVGKASYNEICDYLEGMPFTVKATPPTPEDWGEHMVTDKSGATVRMVYIHPQHNPDWENESSYNNPDRVTIWWLEYVVDEQRIALSSGVHGQPMQLYTRSLGGGETEVDEMDDLLTFYQDSMGGVLSERIAAMKWGRAWTEKRINSAFNTATVWLMNDFSEYSFSLSSTHMTITILHDTTYKGDEINDHLLPAIHKVIQYAGGAPVSVKFAIKHPASIPARLADSWNIGFVEFDMATWESLDADDIKSEDIPYIADDYTLKYNSPGNLMCPFC